MSEKAAPPQISTDDRFQRREWVVQRVGWALMCLTLVAALLGLLGGRGILSETEAASADGRVKAEYERFTHRHRELQIQFEVKPGPGEELCRVAISQDYLRRLDVENVTPQPESVETTADAQVYAFRVARGEGGVLRVVLHGKFERAGRARAAVSTGESRLEFEQWVYP